jgi:hypothetical protein
VPQQNWEDKEAGPLYYTPRSDELSESSLDIAFLLGESDATVPFTTIDTEEGKPVRMLHDWAIFDARPSKAKGDGGALALALVSLQVFDSAFNGGIRRAPEGAGSASPFFENEEDAGQEDDGDYDDGDNINGEDSEEGRPVSVRLRLGALLRYTIDYTKRDEYVLAPLWTPLWTEMVTFMYMRSDMQPNIPRDYHGVVHSLRALACLPPALRAFLLRAQDRTGARVCSHARPTHTPRGFSRRTPAHCLRGYGWKYQRVGHGRRKRSGTLCT